MPVALCAAKLLPRDGENHINSMIIPFLMYLIWIIIKEYKEGIWNYDGWDRYEKYW